jgi:hypothetical protein
VISAATGAAGSAATSAVSDRALKKEQIMSKSLYVQLKQEREVVAMMRDAATPQDAIAHPKDSTD